MKSKTEEILNNCEAFLFDKDGTLIDFNSLWIKWSLEAARLISDKTTNLTEKDILSQWGIAIDSEIIDPEGPMAVGSLDDLIVSAAGLVYRHSGLWPESKKLACDAVNAASAKVSKKKYTKPIKGIPEMVCALKEKGYKLAVVTTDNTDSALADMEVIGLADCFSAVLGCDKVKNCKPFPDLVIEACRLLEVMPEKAAVVGDTRADMLMGRSAGVSFCVGVASGVGKPEKLAEYADIVLPSAAHLIG